MFDSARGRMIGTAIFTPADLHGRFVGTHSVTAASIEVMELGRWSFVARAAQWP